MSWTNEQRTLFSKSYIYTCKLYDKEIGFEIAKMVLEDLQDLDFDIVLLKLNEFRKNPKNKFWPKPADLRELCNPSITSDTIANEVASKIREAIGKFGWCNENEAKNFIGDIGWKVVESNGGWVYVCENHGVSLNPLTFHAQARDLVKGKLELDKFGMLDKPINIGYNDKKQLENKGFNNQENVLKQLPELKRM